ncbi:flagellar hook-basal body complex protein FliE [Thioclava sp. F28-4]|uniref:flagellar hook-basal body complex protein FliE n=1 Tax=Thioclava sp. F28-4 TaxID=1915315 RepID=UPI00352B8BF0
MAPFEKVVSDGAPTGEVTEAGGSGPGSLFEQAANSFVDAVKAGEDTAKAAMAGQADPHALVQALAQTELAIEAAVTVRNKVVEAYQEILRMPV